MNTTQAWQQGHDACSFKDTEPTPSHGDPHAGYCAGCNYPQRYCRCATHDDRGNLRATDLDAEMAPAVEHTPFDENDPFYGDDGAIGEVRRGAARKVAPVTFHAPEQAATMERNLRAISDAPGLMLTIETDTTEYGWDSITKYHTERSGVLVWLWISGARCEVTTGMTNEETPPRVFNNVPDAHSYAVDLWKQLSRSHPLTAIRCKLVGTDGNAYALTGRVSQALRRGGRRDLVEPFQAEAMSSDYNNLLRVCMKYVEVD